MQDSQFYWSDQARSEFSALFDDGAYSERFRQAVAEALTRGWSGNRDKPFWAMSVLLMLLGAEGSGSGEGLEIVALNVADVQQRLEDVDPQVLAPAGITVETDDGAIVVRTPDGPLRLTRHRIRVIAKLAEFLLTCDAFAHAGEIMSAFARLAGGEGHVDYGVAKDTTREMARIAYRFRSQHFLDGHAASAFSIIKRFLAARDFEIADETVLGFWTDPENDKYKTYEATFQAFAQFADSVKTAQSVHAAGRALDINEPGVADAAQFSSFANWDEAEDAADDAETACTFAAAGDAGGAGGDDDGSTEDGQPQEATLQPSILADAGLRLVKHAQADLLARLIDAGKFGLEHPLASLRLVAFHPVQSGISNGLRTGRWKMPLHERVKCGEARAYPELVAEVEELIELLTSWIEVAFAVRARDSALDPQSDAVRQAGFDFLARSRAKSLQKSPEELQRAFAAVTPVLLNAREAAIAYRKSVLRRFPQGAAPEIGAQFADDRERFAAEFARRYLDDAAAASLAEDAS